jgi:hypothetical protein
LIRAALLIVGVLFSAASPVAAEDFPVINKSKYRVEVWVKRGNQKWSKPIKMKKGAESKIDLDHIGTYYIAVRDKYGRDKHVGRYDLRNELQNKPGVKLYITQLYGGKLKEPMVDAELLTDEEYKKREVSDE